jgi:hypothetical protein
MSEVNPSSPPPTLPHTITGEHPKAVINNPPESFSRKLSIGTRFEAVLYFTSKKNQYEIQTPFGRTNLNSSTPLPNNSNLILQLVSKANQLQVLITSINGLPPLKALRAGGLLSVSSKDLNLRENNKSALNDLVHKLPHNLKQNTQKGSNTKTSVTSVDNEKKKIESKNSIIGTKAIVTFLSTKTNATDKSNVTGIPLKNSTNSALENAFGKARQALMSGGTQLSISKFLTQQKYTINRIYEAGKSFAQTSNQQTTNTVQKSISDGTKFTVKINSFQLPPATKVITLTQSGSYFPAVGSNLTGVITSISMPSGHPVIQTHIGSLAIATNLSLPIGSQLTFEVINTTQPNTNTNFEVKTIQTALSQHLTQQWPALQEAIYTLNQVNPTAAQQLLNAVIPHPGQSLGGNIIFFMMALSGSNLSNWFGDLPTRALQISKPELLAKLKKDFAEIDRFSRKPSSIEWRSTMIPFHDGIQLNPLRFSINCNSNKKGQKFKGGANFIIDLDLKVTGRFQIDGIVYQERKRLDLIIRTKNRLPQRTEAGIREIFQESADTIGLMGGVVFQSSPANFIETLDNKLNSDMLGSLV